MIFGSTGVNELIIRNENETSETVDSSAEEYPMSSFPISCRQQAITVSCNRCFSSLTHPLDDRPHRWASLEEVSTLATNGTRFRGVPSAFDFHASKPRNTSICTSSVISLRSELMTQLRASATPSLDARDHVLSSFRIELMNMIV